MTTHIVQVEEELSKLLDHAYRQTVNPKLVSKAQFIQFLIRKGTQQIVAATNGELDGNA